MVETSDRTDYRILICLIEIWAFNEGDDPLKEPESPKLFAEVEKIEIEETYRKLICGASVKFPRGTILHRTLTPTNGWIYDRNTTATLGADGVIVETKNTTPQIKNEAGEWVSVEGSKLAEIEDFKVGDRIRISLGYTKDPKVVDMISYNTTGESIYTSKSILQKYKNELKVMFNGYITKVSLDTPIELECENLASVLKMVTCPKRKGKSDDTVNTFLDSGSGCLDLLKDTGLKLYPKTKSSNISLGKIDLTDDLVLADLFDIWAKRKVYSFIRFDGDTPYLAVGRSYFSNAEDDSVLKLGETNSNIPQIFFDWNVAQNGLTLMSTDKKFVAVEAQCLEQKEGRDKFYKITVIRNPQYDPTDPNSKQYRTLNEIKITKKGLKLGKKVQTDSKDKVNLNKYTVIPYMSRKVDCPHDELVDEAIKYLESYNPNGIDGSLTLFGDLYLTCGIKVQLIDDIHRGKNGYYFVDEVKTEFGVNGFRQTIKLPYCISRTNEQSEQ